MGGIPPNFWSIPFPKDEYQFSSGTPSNHWQKGFVTGHDFSRADGRPYRISALAAAKAQVAENKCNRG
jgi:hypothetical protein